MSLSVWPDISPYPFVSVAEADGYAGPGFYAWDPDHPENGAHFFDHSPTWQELYNAGYPMFECCDACAYGVEIRDGEHVKPAVDGLEYHYPCARTAKRTQDIESKEPF